MTTKAVITTNLGNFTIHMEMDRAPITAGNFVTLAKKGFYDGIVFHRVIKGFMIQGGDPKGNGTGGPGYTIQDEFHPELKNDKYTISMANAGPNTGGSQFFINVADNHFLNRKHAVFGDVVDGMDIILKISEVSTNANDRPLEDVVMQKVEIIES